MGTPRRTVHISLHNSRVARQNQMMIRRDVFKAVPIRIVRGNDQRGNPIRSLYCIQGRWKLSACASHTSFIIWSRCVEQFDHLYIQL